MSHLVLHFEITIFSSLESGIIEVYIFIFRLGEAEGQTRCIAGDLRVIISRLSDMPVPSLEAIISMILASLKISSSLSTSSNTSGR